MSLKKESSSAPKGSGEIKRGRGRRFDRNLRDDEETGSSERNDDIPPEVKALLFDNQLIAESIAKGKCYVDTTGMDPLETLFAEGYIESFKTQEKRVITVVSSRKKKKLPKLQARSMTQMLNYSKPIIRTAQPGTAAYAVAEEAWQVLQILQ